MMCAMKLKKVLHDMELAGAILGNTRLNETMKCDMAFCKLIDQKYNRL